MADNYLTVKQFAAAAGVSQQAVYKRLGNSLKPYYKIIDGKKMIEREGLGLYQFSTNFSTSQPTSQPTFNNQVENLEVVSPPQDFSNTLNSTNQATKQTTEEAQFLALNKTLEILQKELEVKNKQIDDLNNRLAEALKTVEAQNILISQQQHLSLLDKTDGKKSQAEASKEVVYAEEEQRVPATSTMSDKGAGTIEKEERKNQEKRSLFKRLFGIKE